MRFGTSSIDRLAESCLRLPHVIYHGRIQRGGGGTEGPDPPEKSQNIGFLEQ